MLQTTHLSCVPTNMLENLFGCPCSLDNIKEEVDMNVMSSTSKLPNNLDTMDVLQKHKRAYPRDYYDTLFPFDFSALADFDVPGII